MKKNILICLFCLIVSGIVSYKIGIDGGWDLYSYHYYNAFAVLNHKVGYDLMPAGIQTYLNPVMDIIYYLIMVIFQYKKEIALFLFGLPWGCLIFLLYLINEQLFCKASKNNIVNYLLILFATIIGATECVIFSEIGTSYHDITIGVFVLLVIFLILRYFDTNVVKNISYAGFFMGVVCGLKLIAAPYFVTLFVTFFIFNIKDGLKKLLYKMFLFSIFGLFGFLIIDGYWMHILWKKFHNPVFPMFNKIFKSEWFTYVNYKDMKYADINIIQYLFYPFIWSNVEPNRVCEGKFFDFRHSFSYVCLVFSSIWFIVKSKLKNLESLCDKKQLFIIVFVVISYLLWVKTFGILRYLLPTLSLTGTIITIFVSQIKPIINRKALAFILILLLFAACNYKYKHPYWHKTRNFIEAPDFPIRKNSVVFLYGKPVGISAAKLYPNVRFIYLYDDVDGQPKDFTPSQKYYDYVDKIIQNKHKYIILDRAEYLKDDEMHRRINKKYIDKYKLSCRKQYEIFFYNDIEFCEYLD